MAWIESHQTIEKHPKTLKLKSLMGWDLDRTIGKLHRFWWWCLDFAPDGNVSRLLADMSVIDLDLTPDETHFFNAMVESGFIDHAKNLFLVHDWPDYAGRYLRDSKFKRHPERWQNVLKLYKKLGCRLSADNQPTVSQKSAVPNQPDQPNKPKNRKKPITLIPDDFGISDSIRNWAKEKGYANIEAHLENFRDICLSKGYKFSDWDAAIRRAIREDWAKLRKGGVYEHHRNGNGNSYDKDQCTDKYAGIGTTVKI